MLLRRTRSNSHMVANAGSVFIVKRTSRRCWRCMAFNVATSESRYMSAGSAEKIGKAINDCAKEWYGVKM